MTWEAKFREAFVKSPQAVRASQKRSYAELFRKPSRIATAVPNVPIPTMGNARPPKDKVRCTMQSVMRRSQALRFGWR